jgi:hypothetical protein
VVPRKRRKTAAVKAWWAEYKRAEGAHGEATGTWYDAQTDFLKTQPTTVAGLLAFVNHVDSHCDPDKGWDDEWGNDAFPTSPPPSAASSPRGAVMNQRKIKASVDTAGPVVRLAVDNPIVTHEQLAALEFGAGAIGPPCP